MPKLNEEESEVEARIMEMLPILWLLLRIEKQPFEYVLRGIENEVQ